MQFKVYVIRDNKAETYNTPFFCRADGEATRNLAELVKDEKSMVSKYPEDYDLYRIGEYSQAEGLIVGHDTPQHIAKAVAFKLQN